MARLLCRDGLNAATVGLNRPGVRHARRVLTGVVFLVICSAAGLASASSAVAATDSAARAATARAFPEFINNKGWSDLQDQPGATIRQYVGDTAAVVQADNRQALVNSLLPLRSGEGAAKKPIDTDTSLQTGRLRLDQPLSEYSLAPSLGDGSLVHFPNSGLRVGLGDGVRGQARGVKQGETLVYANAKPGVNALIKSLPTGVQVAFSIQDAQSARRFVVDIDPAPGDDLVATSPQAAEDARKGPVGGAVVLRDGKQVTSITPAVAFDAAGKNVAVETTVGEGAITYEIKPTADTSWPALLDPYISEDQRYWFGQPPAGTPPTTNPVPDFNGWSFGSTPALLAGFAGNGAYGNGLNIFGSSGITYPSGGTVGFWTYQAPFNASFPTEGLRIVKADFGYTAHVRSQPFGSSMVQGIYSRTTGFAEAGGLIRGAGLNDGFAAYQPVFGLIQNSSEGIAGNKATYPYRVHCLSPCNAQNPTGDLGKGSSGNQARFGLVQQAGRPSIAGAAFMGSSLIFLTEQAKPRLTITGTSPTLTRTPSDVTILSNDYGAGPSAIQVYEPETAEPIATATQVAPCTGAGVQPPPNGTIDSPGAAHSGDRNHRCTAPISLTIPAEDLPEGTYDLTIKSQDIIGNEIVETRRVSIDREGPDTGLDGLVSKGPDEDSPLPDGIDGYVNGQLASQLTAEATDETGVKALRLNELLGGLSPALAPDDAPDSAFETVPKQLGDLTRACSGTSCAPTETLQAATGPLTQGLHTFNAVASDSLGNESDAAFDVLVDTDPPPPPDLDTFAIIESDPLAGTATVAWVDQDDLVLPDGHPGSGFDFAEARYRVGGELLGTWSDWQGPLDDSELAISGLGLGVLPLDVEVRAVDTAGNRSRAVNLKKPSGNKTQEGGRRGNSRDPNVGASEDCTVVVNQIPAQNSVVESDRVRWDDVLIHGRARVTCQPFTTAPIKKIFLETCLRMKNFERRRLRRQVCDTRTGENSASNPADINNLLDMRCRAGDRIYEIRAIMVITYVKAKVQTPLPLLEAEVGQENVVRKVSSAEKEYRCPAANTWRFIATHNLENADRLSEMERISPSKRLRRSLIRNKQPVPPIPSSIGRNPNGSSKPSWAAHHMIAANETQKDAPISQGYGFVCGLGPNDYTNGAWLRDEGLRTSEPAYQDIEESPIDYKHRAFHGPSGGIHTGRYFNQVALNIRYRSAAKQTGDFMFFYGGGVNGGGFRPPSCSRILAGRRLRKRVRAKLYENTFPFRVNGLGDNDPTSSDDD